MIELAIVMMHIRATECLFKICTVFKTNLNLIECHLLNNLAAHSFRGRHSCSYRYLFHQTPQ